MALSAKVDGVDVVVHRKSYNINMVLEERGTAYFTVVDLAGTADYVRGMPVEIYDQIIPWLSGWSYRKEITIEGSIDDAQTDYQMKLWVYSNPGNDLDDVVHLAGHCADFPNDIKFTTSDGVTELDYWVEDANADPCPIWIEFDSIPVSPGTATFYIYYGKPSQGSSSDGEATFPDFFDDFPGASLDTGKWDGNEIYASVADSILTFTTPGGWAYIYGTTSVGRPHALRARVKLSDNNAHYTGVSFRGVAVTDFITTNINLGSGQLRSMSGGVGATKTGQNCVVAGLFALYDIRWRTDNVDYLVNDVACGGSPITSHVPTVNLPVHFGVNFSGSLQADWILIRKYTTNEPIFGTWGIEEYDPFIFSGYIYEPGKVRIGTGSKLLHDVICTDNHYLADKRLVVKSYADKTLAHIVNDIWTDYLDDEGVTIGEIQTGPTIKSAIFNYVKVSEAFDALKELSGFTWFIDEYKALYFVDRSTYLAPWQLDNETHRAISGSVSLTTGNPLYRNVQIKRGGMGETVEQTEIFTGDGVTLAFGVGYPIAQVPTVTVADRTPEGQTVGIKGIDTGKDCYWYKGDDTIVFTIEPENGKAVTIVYKGQYPLITKVVDYGAMLDRKAIEGGSGIVEEIATEAQHETSDAITESAKATLSLYCQDAERFLYQTYESGLKPGQLQAITYSPFGFSAHDMLIESVSITTNGDDVRYNISCITGPVMGSWTRFFSGILTRQDKTIKIGDEMLLVLFQQAETLSLEEATALHEDLFTYPPGVNRWIALPPTQSEGHNVQHEALALAEAPALTSHATEDYEWDDGCLWDFATWA